MDRLPPLAPEAQTADQREAIAEVTAGPRGALVGPFVPLSRAPELMRRLQRVGEHFRWGSCSLPDDVRELAVLMVARHWDQQVEWALHRDLAEGAGVPAEVCDAVSEGRRPALDPALGDAYDVVAELLVRVPEVVASSAKSSPPAACRRGHDAERRHTPRSARPDQARSCRVTW